MEHHRAVRIADLTPGQAERNVRIRRLTFLGVTPLDSHLIRPFCFWRGARLQPLECNAPTLSPRRRPVRPRPPNAEISLDASVHSLVTLTGPDLIFSTRQPTA